ncbi:MAG: GGDEF domain-containing protein [Chlamydiota bacterium]|nr:GGDEF domain-containing protein [Chlamydiota bacterium]
MTFDPRKTIIIKPNQTEPVDENGKEPETCLVILSGNPLGNLYHIEKNENHIGRDPSSEIPIHDEAISRTHATLFKKGNDWFLVDHNSANGTFINFKRITESPLKHGDCISIGRTVLKFIHTTDAESSYYKQIYDLATKDGLTEIPNKRSFEDYLKKEFTRSARYHLPFSIMMFDIDHFKAINDTYGHPAGDFVLRGIANILSDSIRVNDYVARYGGEEFVILLTLSNLHKSVIIANRIRLIIQNKFFEWDSSVIRSTVSIGIAEFQNDDTMESLIKRADALLYRAKNSGRNRVYI